MCCQMDQFSLSPNLVKNNQDGDGQFKMYSNFRWSMLCIAELYSWWSAQLLRETDRELQVNFSSFAVIDVDVRLRR